MNGFLGKKLPKQFLEVFGFLGKKKKKNILDV